MLQTYYAECIHIGLNQVKNKCEVSNVDLCVLFATQQKNDNDEEEEEEELNSCGVSILKIYTF